MPVNFHGLQKLVECLVLPPNCRLMTAEEWDAVNKGVETYLKDPLKHLRRKR